MSARHLVPLLFALAFGLPGAGAQSLLRPSMERAQRWDLSLGIAQQDSESIGGQQGSRLEIKDELGWRFAFDYNFNNHFALGFGMEYIEPDYSVTIVPQDTGEPQTVSYTASQFNGQLKGTWNFLAGPLTPFVEGSIGWTYFDSNVADGPPVTGCWWDPWWGYICSRFWSTYSESNFSYSAGAGLRWDITEAIFAKAGYHLLILDLSQSDNPGFGAGRLEFGWRF